MAAAFGTRRPLTWPVRKLVENRFGLDAARLAREGALLAGTITRWQWQNPAGTLFAAITAEETRVVIAIGETRQVVELDTTAPSTNDQCRSVWFLCPACQRRCRKLHYADGERKLWFLCRICLRLDYTSRHCRRFGTGRALRRIERLHRKLAGYRNRGTIWYARTVTALAANEELVAAGLRDVLSDLERRSRRERE